MKTLQKTPMQWLETLTGPGRRDRGTRAALSEWNKGVAREAQRDGSRRVRKIP